MSLFYNTLLPPLTTGCQPHQSSVSYPFLFRHHFPPPMRGASKFSLLFATPVSFLHHHRRTSLLRLSRTISISLIFPTPPQSHLLPIKASSKEFHTRTNHTAVDGHFGGPFPSSHPLPEWSKLVETVSALGYLDYSRGLSIPVNEFVSYDGLPEQFVRDAAACLSFACDRPDILGLLSRRHIEMLVENGAPFLFKSALDTERRMRSFLGSSGRSHVVESDKAETVDLMMYIVSYASNPTATGRNNSSNPEFSESSVRFLLNQLVDMSCRAKESDGNAPEQYQNSGSYGQTSRFLGPKIEMKRGDWICSQCSFMNFARNLKCLECEGPRPKRQLTGGEWECPQCDFLNYGRNMVCLRCDRKRPGEALSGCANSMSVSGYNNGGYAGNDAANGEKTQRWFSDVSQQHPSSDMNNMMNNEEFPEIMSLRKEVNKFVLSTRNTPLDGRLANSQNHATDGSSPRSRTSSQYGNNRGSNTGYTPFVPLPADMFAKKNQESTTKDGKEAGMKISDATSSKVHDETGIVDISNKSVRLEGSLELSEKPSKEAGRYSEEKNQDEKTERWFKRVAELHDVPDLASAVSDEDFPDIMPTRKGENRFVISKRKDRSLTSPAYKRQNPIEQGNNAQFVPFVPFPPDYFAKKDTQPASRTGEISSKNSTLGMNNISEVQRTETQKRDNKAAEFGDHRRSTSGSNSFGSQTNSTSNSWNTSVGPTTSQISNSEVNPSQPQENQNVRSGWTGKSLEGSAVKEADPLDMSEEAKAERWFRRVAQIKDISELSQIPDEDFPSIMPMRKGVNRFVVSKRKTPLERRLTSPQYRKNLPVINSDPLKKENDNS